MAEIRNEPGMSQGELAQKFVQFLMMQAQNVLYVLGRIPSPDGRQPQPNLEAAKIFIDQLEVLRIKTQGNLIKQEEKIFEETLTSLRLAFVEASGGTPPSMMPERNMGFDLPDLEEELAADDSTKPAASVPPPAEEVSTEPKEDPQVKKYFKSYG